MSGNKDLAARLLELSVKSTQDPLHEEGRYFNGDWCDDLTQCSHGDTGNYRNKRDGQFIALLWNSYRSGDLITRAEAEAMVAKEERQHEHTISERDRFCDWADKLAFAIGGDDIGEHSSENNPWQNALDRLKGE